MGWNYLSISKFQRWNRWSLGMDKQFHPTHFNGCNHLSMVGLKLNHVSKGGPGGHHHRRRRRRHHHHHLRHHHHDWRFKSPAHRLIVQQLVRLQRNPAVTSGLPSQRATPSSPSPWYSAAAALTSSAPVYNHVVVAFVANNIFCLQQRL